MPIPRGIDLRQSGSGVLVRVGIDDSSGNALGSGAAALRVMEYQPDGSLRQLDFADNGVKASGITTPSAAMTARSSVDGLATGIWTYVLTSGNCANFTTGNVYIVAVTHSSLSGVVIRREWQYGGAEGDLSVSAAGNIAGSVGSVAGAVGSVAGAVGSVTAPVTAGTVSDKAGYSLAVAPPTVAAIVSGVWDEPKLGHATAGTFGLFLDAAVSSRSTYAGADTAGTATLLTRIPGTVQPQTGDSYARLGAPVGASISADIQTRSIYSGGAVASVASPVTVGTNNDKSGYILATAPPTLAAIVTGVWDEPKASHTTAGTFGLFLDAAVSTRLASSGYTAPTDPWATVLPGGYGAGTAGKVVGTNLDATVSSRSTFAGGAVASVTAPVTAGTVTDKSGYSLTTTPPTAAQVAAAVWTDSAGGDFSVPGSVGGLLMVQLAGAFVGTTSAFTTAALANGPAGAGGAASTWQDPVGSGDFAVPGSIGAAVVAALAKLDATVSSRLSAADYTAPTDPWTMPVVGTSYAIGTAGGILGALAPSTGGGTNFLQQTLTGDTTVSEALVAVFSYCCGAFSNPTANAVNNTWIDWQRRNPVTDEIAYVETVDPVNRVRTGFRPANLG